MIRVTSTALNAGVLARQCIESVKRQSFKEWTHDFVDAKSTDDTVLQALGAASGDPRVTIHKNETNRLSVFGNLLPLWRAFDDDDIIVWVDGDDRLANDEVLETIYQTHKSGALVTYGQFIWSDGTMGFAAQVGPDPRSEAWRATHLKTFRAGLVKKIKDEDLRWPATGDYFQFVTDGAIMLPLLEMVPERAVFISKILHIYNHNHSHMAQRPQDFALEAEVGAYIRRLPRYKPIAQMNKPQIAPTGYWAGDTAHLHHNCSMPLATWIATYLAAKKDSAVYDFGCGVGSYLKVLHENGFEQLLGFEGDIPTPRMFEHIQQRDLTQPYTVVMKGNVICLEVAEHIPAEFEDVFLDNVTGACNDRLILSWAIRGQGGDGHVNCLDNYEVIGRICKRGFKYLPLESAEARAVITDLPWFKNTIMIFERIPESEAVQIPTNILPIRKLEIGAGPVPHEGYEHNDLNPGPGIDHVGAIQDLDFPDGTFVEVYGTGAFEHLTYAQAIKFLKKSLRWLTPGGVLDINTPDMMGWVADAIHERKFPAWITAAFEGWCRWPGDEHKSFWTEPLLVMALHEVGFERVHVYQRWAYVGPEDWHICVKAYRPKHLADPKP
jgi:predicted SAM-dependent methyltransferase/glycosyltransferase involved in cell wall biosynthesis